MKRLVILMVVPLFFVNCGGDDPIDVGTAPSIPPATSMIMDMSVATGNAGGRQMTKNNWTVASLNVGFWNTILTLNLAVPVASFVNALNKTPTFDASIPGWVWEYDYDVFGVSHHAKLIGKVNTSNIEWEMLITRRGFYDDFSWYTGTSSLTGTSGTWRLNRDPDNPEPYIDIVWNRALDGSTGDIRYTNIIPNDLNNGSYIFQQSTTDVDFDRLYELFFINADRTVTINWSSDKGNGRLKDPTNYGDDNWRCWDENQDDIDCPG